MIQVFEYNSEYDQRKYSIFTATDIEKGCFTELNVSGRVLAMSVIVLCKQSSPIIFSFAKIYGTICDS